MSAISLNIEATKATFCHPVHYKVSYTFFLWTTHSSACNGSMFTPSKLNCSSFPKLLIKGVRVTLPGLYLLPLGYHSGTHCCLCLFLHETQDLGCIAVWLSLCPAICSFVALCCSTIVIGGGETGGCSSPYSLPLDLALIVTGRLSCVRIQSLPWRHLL